MKLCFYLACFIKYTKSDFSLDAKPSFYMNKSCVESMLQQHQWSGTIIFFEEENEQEEPGVLWSSSG